MRLFFHSLIALCALTVGCAGETSDAGDEDAVEDIDSELKTSDFEHRGVLGKDECTHTAGKRARKYITFFFSAKEGDDVDIWTSGYASPDLRIFTDEGKQVLRGRKRFEGDGDTGGFVSEAHFVAPKTARYRIAVRDTSVAPGASVPSWVRPIVEVDDRKTRKRPSACPAQP
jgi:hypothetical protein